MDLLKIERDSPEAARVLIVRAKDKFVLLDLYDSGPKGPTLVLENVVPNLRSGAADSEDPSHRLRRNSVERSIQWALDSILAHGKIVGVGVWDASGMEAGSWTLGKILEEIPPAPQIRLSRDPSLGRGSAASEVMDRLHEIPRFALAGPS